MAESTFKKIDFDKLSAGTKSVIAANAASQGITPEQYYESRGGVNRSGVYGDAYKAAETGGSPYLTDDEYAAVIAKAKAEGKTGTQIGAAINAATAAKQGYSSSSSSYSSSTLSSSGSSSLTPSFTATDGTKFTDQAAFVNYQKMLNENAAVKARDLSERRSAFQILREEFNRYGLGKLVGDIENLLIQGTPPAEYAFSLRQTPTYQARFAANPLRIKKGLRALDEASYVALEDQYQDVMRRYGLPESYYSRDEIGTQLTFQKLIAADVSNVELEKRIQNTQSRIFDANPEVMNAMRQFYPDITGGEILAYALDPETALPQLERKIAAAEIGGAALQAGLTTGLSRAEQLAAAGVTKAAAQEQYGKIASGLERGKRLSEIYQQPAYTQEIAETEAFALSDAEKARRQRRKLTQLETAEFGGTTGMTGGALSRERAGQY